MSGAGRLGQSIDRLVDAHTGEWAPLLRGWRDSAAGRQLIDRVEARRAAGATIYPADVFRALALTPLSRVRVLILGQDPYHGAGQADGLAFSVPPGQRLPPSLRNIFKELQRDMGLRPAPAGSLERWAGQGVLLLNTSLTVEDGEAAIHSKYGWQVLTDKIVSAVAERARPVVFMLWGAHAQSKAGLLAGHAHRHLVLQCNHPSPLSATRGPIPFVGCGHFGRAQEFQRLAAPGVPVLDWALGPSQEAALPGQTVI